MLYDRKTGQAIGDAPQRDVDFLGAFLTWVLATLDATGKGPPTISIHTYDGAYEVRKVPQ
jgi:hypothetical protein